MDQKSSCHQIAAVVAEAFWEAVHSGGIVAGVEVLVDMASVEHHPSTFEVSHSQTVAEVDADGMARLAADTGPHTVTGARSHRELQIRSRW